MHRDQLPISELCHADWSAMSGDAARRFCSSCEKHVHDLSAMTARKAERVLATTESPCVRYAVGADGRVLHATGSRWPRWVAIGAAMLGATPAFASGMAADPAPPPELGLMERVLRRAQEAVGLVPETVVSQGQVEVMGELAIEPSPPPPPPPEVTKIMGKIARPPTIVLPPTPPPAPPVAPPPPDFRQIPTPAPGETVIPEVTEALRGR